MSDIDMNTVPAFVGKAFLAVGNGDSPEGFDVYCNIDTISGIGQKNDLVEVTTFCSNGAKQYIPGLSDGSEVSFSANYSLDDATQEALIDDVDNKANRNFVLTMGDDSPASKVFTFTLAMLSWELDPSVSKQNVIKFTGKMTGPVIRSSTT
jgi:hypothetical protein